MKMIRILSVAWFAFYLSACTIVVNDDMVVSPSKDINKENIDSLTFESGYKPINLLTSDNVKLYGLMKEVDDAEITILILHGNALNLSLQPWFGVLKAISNLKVNILAIDYQGYGFSEGKASFSSMNQNAKTAIDFIPKGQNIYLYGLSLGSVMAAELANDKRVKGVIIEGGLTNEKEMIDLYQSRNTFGSFVSVKLGDKLKFDNIKVFQNLDKPVLVIHGDEDKNIPVSMGQRLFNASINKFSGFYLVKGGGHCDTFIKDKKNYLTKIDAFINGEKLAFNSD